MQWIPYAGAVASGIRCTWAGLASSWGNPHQSRVSTVRPHPPHVIQRYWSVLLVNSGSRIPSSSVSWRVYALLRWKCGFFASAFGQPEVRHAGGNSHEGNYSTAETTPELIEKHVVALVRDVYR